MTSAQYADEVTELALFLDPAPEPELPVYQVIEIFSAGPAGEWPGPRYAQAA